MQTTREQRLLAHADGHVNVNYDETGLRDRQLNSMYQRVFGSTYPITSEVRQEILDRSLKIIRNSESPRDVNAAVRNVLAMDKLNQTSRAAPNEAGATLHLTEVRRQLLDDDEELALLRQEALDADEQRLRLKNEAEPGA